MYVGANEGGVEKGPEVMLEGTSKEVVVGAYEGRWVGNDEGTGDTVGAEVRIGIGAGSGEMVGAVKVEGEPVGGFGGSGERISVGAFGEVEGEPVGGFEGSEERISVGAFGEEEGLGDLSKGALDGAPVRVAAFPFGSFLSVGGVSSGRGKYCDLVEVLRRTDLTVSPRPATGVARANSVVTVTPKTAALDREGGEVFMIHSITLTSGSDYSSS